jgi:hypothetical protein
LVSLYDFFDNGSSCTTRTVSLSIAGLPSGSHAPTSVNGLGKDLINGPEAFEDIQPGTVDIVAARTDAGGEVDRIIVRKDITVPAGGTVTPDIDFDAEGFAPAMMNMTITSLGVADTGVTLTMYYLPGGPTCKPPVDGLPGVRHDRDTAGTGGAGQPGRCRRLA